MTLNQKIEQLAIALSVCNFLKELQHGALAQLQQEKEWLTAVRTVRVLAQLEQRVIDGEIISVNDCVNAFIDAMTDCFLSTLAEDLVKGSYTYAEWSR